MILDVCKTWNLFELLLTPDHYHLLKSLFCIFRKVVRDYLRRHNLSNESELLSNATVYLKDKETEVYGLRIYGSPWQPLFMNWAYNMPRGEKILSKWNLIPEGVDILITHGPPLGK